MTGPRATVVRLAGLAVLAAAIFNAVFEVFDPSHKLAYDFATYVFAARRALSGDRLYLFGDPTAIGLGPFGQFLYPPPIAYAVAPLAHLPAALLVAIVMASLGAIALAVAWSVSRHFAEPLRPWAFAFAIYFQPLIWDVRLGNVNVLTLALCLLAWHLRERVLVGGGLLAAAVGVKLLPLALLAFGVAAGRGRLVLAALGWYALVVLATWPWLGQLWLEYAAVILALSGSPPAPGTNIVPEIFAPQPLRIGLTLTALSLAIASGIAARDRAREARAFQLALAASPMLSPTVWYPYLTLALPLLMGLAARSDPASPWRSAAIPLVAWLAIQYQAIAQPHRDFILPFFGLVLLLAVGLREVAWRPNVASAAPAQLSPAPTPQRAAGR